MDNGFTDALNFELMYGALRAKSSNCMYADFQKRKHFKEYSRNVINVIMLLEKAVRFPVHFLLICGY